MNYIKERKVLLLKYLSIIVGNILLYILCNYYFNGWTYKDILLLLLVVVVDMIIYSYKEKKVCEPYLDMLTNLIVGFILMFFIDNNVVYSNVLLSIVFPNNIVFMRSRYSDKKWKKFLQYLMILIYTIISLFINVLVYNIWF